MRSIADVLVFAIHAGFACVFFGVLAFGFSRPALPILCGVGGFLVVSIALVWRLFSHHSRRQQRDANGRFVPVKRRGEVVDTLFFGENGGEEPKNRG